jgi:hypothetical protein
VGGTFESEMQADQQKQEGLNTLNCMENEVLEVGWKKNKQLKPIRLFD